MTRSLRLTGTVAYNSFRTTPVITQVSGPVARVVVVPGQKVQKGEPMLLVACLGLLPVALFGHWVGHATALRHRDRCWPDLNVVHRLLRESRVYEMVAREGDVLQV